MNPLLFLSVFTILTIFYVILGFIASKKVTTSHDYFLAGRNLGLIPVTFTLIATQIGGGMLLGTSQEAYTAGLLGIFYTLGMALGFIFLGSGIAGKLRSLNVATTAEIFQTQYRSSGLKKIASLLSIVTLCGLLIGQIVGSRMIIAGLGPYHESIFIAFWLFVIIYTMVGGLKAVVMTDVAQVVYIICVFTGIFIYSLLGQPIAAFSFRSILDTQTGYFPTPQLSILQLLMPLVMPALFSLIEQDLAQRFFAARTQRIAVTSALLAGIFMLVFSFIPIYFGMQAKLMGLTVAQGASPLMPLIAMLTNDFVLVLAACGIIAAITSTADSLLCAISSNVAQDFDFSWVGIRNALTRSKIITLIIGLATLGMSYLVPQNIITILINSYQISVSCLLVPLLFAYFSTKLKKTAAMVSVIAGFIGFVLILFWQTDLPKELLPLGLSLGGYLIAHRYAQ